ncbi:hypothetical protein BOTBODRAFT_26945 [Botryobasidium botryosum FD-172 SS1]|uniref:NADP-dependent oxidoreductase domain-containing protein n=1 Tax=Botryobasidium botryosum (strain FD-172 SS1) TaxID=930990 RepID=A0A067MZ97_BOTB1|nr:hypothetical protein BOTBODRAFT_26945 [Botryobasidium botryosum FD-172 SS1]
MHSHSWIASVVALNAITSAHAISASLPTHFELHTGDMMPSIALGLYMSQPSEAAEAVKIALETGYRHFDTAWVYGNEEAVGRAIRDTNVPRSEIWITTKLWNSFHDPANVEIGLNESLVNLGVDYVDLFLMHWPVAEKQGARGEPVTDRELSENPYPTWRAMERLVESGKVRNIGVCNFSIKRLEKLLFQPLKIRPVVNQVEIHFWHPQPEMIAWGKNNGIVIQAWGPFAGSTAKSWVERTLSVPEIKAVAEELGITPAQVTLSWHIQRGTVVLPKSVNSSRIVENYQVVRLPDLLFETIEQAAQSHPPIRTFDPSRYWGLDVFGEGGYTKRRDEL